MATVKCVILGDKGSGKTTLFQSYTALSKGRSLEDLTSDDKVEVPESSNNYTVMKLLYNDMYFLSLFNTSGKEDNDEAMKVFYPNTAAFVVCFSTTSKAGMQSVKEKWLPAIREVNSDAPVLLVGTKIDIRSGDDSATKEEGQALADEVGAVKYLECCAQTQAGVEELFDAALEVGKDRADRSETVEIPGPADAAQADECVAAEKKKYPAPKPPKTTSPARSKEAAKVEEAGIQPPEAEGQKPDAETKSEEAQENAPPAKIKEKKEEETKEAKEEKEEEKDQKKKKKGCTIL